MEEETTRCEWCELEVSLSVWDLSVVKPLLLSKMTRRLRECSFLSSIPVTCELICFERRHKGRAGSAAGPIHIRNELPLSHNSSAPTLSQKYTPHTDTHTCSRHVAQFSHRRQFWVFFNELQLTGPVSSASFGTTLTDWDDIEMEIRCTYCNWQMGRKDGPDKGKIYI